MEKYVKTLMFLTIIMLATQVIKPPGLNLSFFQMLVIATVVIGVPYVLTKKLKKGSYLITSLLWFLSTIVAWLVSINEAWGRSSLLLGTMTSLLLFLIPNIYSRSDLPRLIKAMIWSQYIVIPFSVYCLYINNIYGGVPEIIPLPFDMSITPGDEALDRATAAGEIRLYLPYATPPVLSIVMAMSITLLLFCKNLFNKYLKWILVASFSVILVMTGSRSGIIGISLVMAFLLYKGELRNILKKYKSSVLFFLIVFFVVVSVASETEYVQKMVIGRMENTQNTSLMEDRHFLVPLDGIIIWLESLENFIVGIGFGSGFYMKGAHTFLPPYFLNSFVTLLAERGLMGLTLVIILVRLVVKLFGKRKLMTENEKAISYSLFVGLFCGIFYENFNSYFVIFMIALSFLLESYLPTSLYNKRNT